MKSYICKSCGANILLNDDASFTTCLYCENSIAITSEIINNLNIKKIIPFEIDKEEAIDIFKKTIDSDVVFAKKIYIPVRFCNYDFNYLINYRYAIEDDNGKSYYDAEELVEGTVENEFVFGNSKVNNICYPYELRYKKKIDYDPVLLKDVSIENTVFSADDDTKSKIEDDICNYSRSKIKAQIEKINSIKYFTTNFTIDDYSTLIPIYIMKTSTGTIYNIPGVKLSSEIKNKKKKKIIATICLILIIIVGLLLYFKDGVLEASLTKMLFISIFVIPLLIILLVWYNKKKNISIKTYDNFHSRKHSIYK